jgi:hypothetical protein
MLWCTSVATVMSQSRLVAPVEKNQFSHATSYAELQTFLKQLSAIPNVGVEAITLTKQGRNVSLVTISSSKRFGSDESKLRVLLFAQQHGDEPAGKEALTLLIAKLASTRASAILKTLDLLIVPQMNPDGAEAGRRRTSDTIDLNRNHVLLTSPETKALHDVFAKWKPQVSLDLHEYSSTSRDWADSGLVKTADVQLGMLTHPNTPLSIRNLQHENIYPFIADNVKHKGYSFQEYIVGAPTSRIRNSTTECNDGRQSFGVWNSVSFIQEGRKWGGLNEQLKRRAESQLASIEALLEYCAAHAKEIRTVVINERSKLMTMEGQEVVLRMEHVPGKNPPEIFVYNLRTKKDTMWTVNPFHGIVKSLRTVSVPEAYVVPKELETVVNLLKRHQISMTELRAPKSIHAEIYEIDSIGTEHIEESDCPKPFTRTRSVDTTLQAGAVIVPTRQEASLLITILLEPESVWGLMGYSVFEHVLRRQGTYPILRVVR